jgi:hypothetical protein
MDKTSTIYPNNSRSDHRPIDGVSIIWHNEWYWHNHFKAKITCGVCNIYVPIIANY